MKTKLFLGLSLLASLSWAGLENEEILQDLNPQFKKEQCLVDTKTQYLVCLGEFTKLHQTMYAVIEIGRGQIQYYVVGETLRDQHTDKKSVTSAEYAILQTEFTPEQKAILDTQERISAQVYWTHVHNGFARKGDLKLKLKGQTILVKKFDRVPF